VVPEHEGGLNHHAQFLGALSQLRGTLLQFLGQTAQVEQAAKYAALFFPDFAGKNPDAPAAANLVLSIILVGRMGISGVAWGTTVPSLFISLFFFPRFVSKMVGLSVSTYLWRSWLPPFLGVIPFALACFVTDRYWHATTLVHFFVQLIVILPIYILSIAFFFGRDLLEFLQSLGVLPPRLSRLLRPFGSEKEKAEGIRN